ncbi:hypothetical protein [Tropicimonas sp. S265A]
METASRGSNQIGMRADNERHLLSMMMHASGLAKAEIARKTG